MSNSKGVGYHVQDLNGVKLYRHPAHWMHEEEAQCYLSYYGIRGEVFQCVGKLCTLPHRDFDKVFSGIRATMQGPQLARPPMSAQIAMSKSYQG